MSGARKHYYIGYLLAAALLMASAVLVYPLDSDIYQLLRAFSHRVGKIHIVQELLDLFRPFGKGDVILLIIAGLGVAGARRKAMHVLLALAIMTILIWPFKLAIGRERPGFTNKHSFPSGDAATATAFCVPLMLASPYTAPLAVAIPAGVITGRVYDGRHFPSDALTGAAFGLMAGAIALGLRRRWTWCPSRKTFLTAGFIIIGFSVLNLSWARATPFVLDFLKVWGPLGAFLLIVRLLPVLQRRFATSKPQGTPAPSFFTLPRTLFILIFLIYLLLTIASSLWDRDEPRFSRATVEMVNSGNYLVPTFNGVLRPDKPILIYWLMSLPVRLMGPLELSCRMVAPIATLIAAFLTFWITRRVMTAVASVTNKDKETQTAGITAALILMLSPLMTVSGTAATTDALLLACITGSIAAFFLSWFDGLKLWHIILLMICLAGAMLTKGPVGLAVPLLVISSVLIFMPRGQVRILPYVGWILFAVLGSTLLFLSWGLPANAATNGEFLRLGIGKHVVGRSMEAMESHGGKSVVFYLYYLPILILAFFPWTLYLPRLFARSVTTSSGTTFPARRLLLCWAVPVLALMSLVATKLPHYVLPAWPALAVMSTLGIRKAIREGRPGNRTAAARTGASLFLAIGLILGLGLTIAPWVLPIFGARVPATGVGLIFLTMTGLAWHYYRKGAHQTVAGILVSGMVLALLSAALFLLPAIEQYKVSPKIASFINDVSCEHVPVTTCGYGEPSLIFYLNRQHVASVEAPDLAGWLTAPGPGLLVVTENRLQDCQHLLRQPNIKTLEIISGFNYSQGKWVRIHIVARNYTPSQHHEHD